MNSHVTRRNESYHIVSEVCQYVSEALREVCQYVSDISEVCQYVSEYISCK